MMRVLYFAMLMVGVALCVAVAAKDARGTLTARWVLALPIYTLCMSAMVYMI